MMLRLRRIIQFSQRIIVGLFAVASLGCVSGTAVAGSYDVKAVVPNDPPSQAAIFASGLDGMSSTNAEIQLTGTCQPANPTYVVTVLRSNTVIGSAPCTAGNFSLNVMLQTGDNSFIARTANIANTYGPDSTAITITLRPAQQPIAPAPLNPTTSPTTEPSNPTEETIATNAGAATDLQAVTTEPFSKLDDAKTVTIGVNVTGGSSPYLINLNWGDGSVESHWVQQTGIYTYSHTYQTVTNYQIRGSVRDVLGAMTIFNYAVVNSRPLAQEQVTTTAVNSSPTKQNTWPATITALGGGVLIAGLGYWLGAHHLVRERVTKVTSRASKQSSGKAGRKHGKKR